MTEVVNIKHNPNYDIYCGRANRHYNLPQSKWANPFPITPTFSREAAIEKYRLWINSRPELLRALPELKGKVLGCWCVPEKCHAQTLAELCESKYICDWFSNMLPFEESLVYEGITYKTVENFYQAMKLPRSCQDLRGEIAAKSPFDAKKSIRDRERYQWDANWTQEKALKVMEFALKHKFKKGTDWARKLDLTEDWEIVEWSNWQDFWWGKDIQTEEGQNHLGKLIMKIRAANRL